MKYFLILLLVLSGCSGLSKSDCNELDMVDTGHFDVNQGYDETHYQHWAEKCQKHKITLDKDLYMQGRKRAYFELCNFENGYMDGQSKRIGTMYCPPKLKIKYDKGFAQGSGESSKIQLQQNQTARVFTVTDNQKVCEEHKDCVIKDTCKYNKCLLSSNSCLLDRDCTLNGICQNKKCSF